jgi:26S proteasome regulatory subunit N4
LRNDYKDLMKEIEKHLHEHFESLNEEVDAEQAGSASEQASELPDFSLETQEPPFAKVNSVSDGSPAQEAGMRAGDLIRSFGYVNHTNHDNLRRVGQCVAGNEGVSCHRVAKMRSAG